MKYYNAPSGGFRCSGYEPLLNCSTQLRGAKMQYKLLKDDFYLYTLEDMDYPGGKIVDIPEPRVKWIKRILEENKRLQDYLRELDYGR